TEGRRHDLRAAPRGDRARGTPRRAGRRVGAQPRTCPPPEQGPTRVQTAQERTHGLLRTDRHPWSSPSLWLGHHPDGRLSAVTATGSGRPLPRKGRTSAPIIVVGSLLAALGLTAMGDTYAQAQRADPRKHARLTPDHDATELRVLDWTLWNVSKYYVEPERIDPRAMTLAALEALEQDIAEVLVEPLDRSQGRS